MPSQPAHFRTNRYFLIALLIVLTVVCIPVIRMFAVPLVVASAFAALFFPAYLGLRRLLRNNGGLSAFIMCVLIFLVLLVPAYVVINAVVRQSQELYVNARPLIRDFTAQSDTGALANLKKTPAGRWLKTLNIDWEKAVQDAGTAVGKATATVINRASASVFELIATLFVTFFCLFYFFIDGERIMKTVRYLSPLRKSYEDLFISRFVLMARATVKGTLVVALIQGPVGGLTLLVFGVKSWVLWWAVMVVLPIIPLCGAWMVLVPTGVVYIVTGRIWQGIAIILISTFIVSTIDNVLRPRLVGQSAKMHDLIVFFSSIGGIATLGPMGIIAGPVIAALFVAAVEVYGMEFKSQLDDAEADEGQPSADLPAS